MFGKTMETDVNHKIVMRKPKTSQQIIEYIKSRLGSVYSKPKINKVSENQIDVDGLILGTIGLLGIKLNIDVNVSDDEARIKMQGKTKRGPLFWITWACMVFIVIMLYSATQNFLGVIIGFIPIIAFNIMIGKVEGKPKMLVDKLVQEIDVEFR
jgi:hypothetical protein